MNITTILLTTAIATSLLFSSAANAQAGRSNDAARAMECFAKLQDTEDQLRALLKTKKVEGDQKWAALKTALDNSKQTGKSSMDSCKARSLALNNAITYLLKK